MQHHKNNQEVAKAETLWNDHVLGQTYAINGMHLSLAVYAGALELPYALSAGFVMSESRASRRLCVQRRNKKQR